MKDAKPHILVVDDDDRLRGLLKKFLHDRGFMVTVAQDAAEARSRLAWFIFDLLILDVMMPGESGLELLASLKDNATPVLMLSAMGDSGDRIRGLEKGAEDYMAKPFEPKELVLRIQTILRRHSAPEQKTTPVTFGRFRFDLATSQLRRDDEHIALTSNEMAMLKLLAQSSGKPVTREELLRELPGVGTERAVDVQITRLRKKIEGNGKPVYLQTVRGAGYVLYADREAS